MLQETTLRNLSEKMREPEWMLTKRLEGFERFKELEFPWFKYGLGIFFEIKELDLSEVDPNIIEEEIVVKNSDGCEVLSFGEAFAKHGEEMRSYLFEEGENKLVALHQSFFNNGLFVRIPEGKVLEKPLQINLELKSNTRIDYILIVAEKWSEGDVIEFSKSDGNGKQRLRSVVVNVVVKEGAKLEYKSVQNFDGNVINLINRKGRVEKAGSLLWVDCCLGSKKTQNNTKTYLVGEGAEGRSWGVAYGDKEQVYGIGGETVHSASNSVSDMAAKVVLNDKAKIIYRGLVRIDPKAVNCEGYQQEDTILLSDEAEANTVPNLEIENNEVKCSHGATITQIDEDKMFYMMCRGIEEHSAKTVIVEGFFEPIVSSIDDEEIRENIKDSLRRRLKYY